VDAAGQPVLTELAAVSLSPDTPRRIEETPLPLVVEWVHLSPAAGLRPGAE
jgi:hypothetical protein